MTVMSLAISLKYKLSFKNDIDTKEHEYMQKSRLHTLVATCAHGLVLQMQAFILNGGF